MSKENNCHCVVCQVEHDLLDSLSTQIARTHFQALAHNYPELSHFDSPAAVIARLHEHEEVEVANHTAWNKILHALVDSIADGTADEIGQQLLLVAYAPAIHKIYREIRLKFPGLCPDDVAQQAAVCFLETARSPEMQSLNGQLPVALARRFRQSLFRWAIAEARQSVPWEQLDPNHPERQTSASEGVVQLEHLLSKAQDMNILSADDCELLRKFHCEGFRPHELREGDDAPSPIALYYRIQRAVHRLRRLSTAALANIGRCDSSQTNSINHKKSSKGCSNSPGRCALGDSEKGFSPELSHHVPQFESDVVPFAA
jgi:hypothetical protein